MKVKTKFLKIGNEILGEEDTFLLVRAEQYKKFDQNTGKIKKETIRAKDLWKHVLTNYFESGNYGNRH